MIENAEPMTHFPVRLRGLPRFDGPFDAHRLAAEGCEVLLASYPAGTVIAPHAHATDNVGVVTQGEMILDTGRGEQRFAVGAWYRIARNQTHSARFEQATSQIEFWFEAEAERA